MINDDKHKLELLPLDIDQKITFNLHGTLEGSGPKHSIDLKNKYSHYLGLKRFAVCINIPAILFLSSTVQ